MSEERLKVLEQKAAQTDEYIEQNKQVTEDLKICVDNLNKAIESKDSATAQELQEIKSNLKSISDLLAAWNNAKGFVNTISWIATFIKWCAIIGTVIAGAWYFIKTGHSPKG